MTNLAPSDREVVADEGWRLSPATLLTEIAPGHIPPKHLSLLAWFLKAVQRGVIRRLAISLPPGHAKSSMVSWAFPTWLLDWTPETQLILASYEASRAVHWSAKVRDTLRDKQLDLRAEVGSGSEARNEWFTTAGGRMLAAGLNGPITGVRAHGLIVDDPIKNAEEASSITMRDRAWSNYESAALTRLFPKGWIVVCQCMMEGVPVLTGDGTWREIQTLRAGDEVYSYDEQVGIRRRKVLDVRRSGDSECVRVRTKRLDTAATPEHPFLVVVDEHGGQLEVGLKYHTGHWRTEWRKAADLQVGDVVVTAKCLPPEDGTRRGMGLHAPPSAPKVIDNEFLWLLGYLYGDGWVTRWKRTEANDAYCVCAAIGVNEAENERVAAAMTRYLGRRPTANKAGYWRLDSAEAYRLLVDTFGFAGKAKTKRLPEWIKRLPASRKRAFLRGLCCADGTKLWRNRDTERLRLANESLIDDVYWMALTCGVRPTRPTKSVQTSIVPSTGLPVTCTAWCTNLSFLPHRFEGKTFAHGFPWKRHYRLERITELTRTPIAPTWDLAVESEDPHGGNFIAGGFVVHNTRWHEDDLVGRLIRRQTHDNVRWVYLRLPAVATEFETIDTVIGKDTAEWLRARGERLPRWERAPGEPLWPTVYDTQTGEEVSYYDAEWVAEKRSESDHHTWETVYQQNPTVPGGDMFPEIQWGRANAVPAGCRFARGWDLAGTAGAGDWTVGALIAVHPTRGVTVVDVVRGQWDGAGVIATMRATAERDHERLGAGVVIQVVEQEPGSSGRAWVSQIIRELAPYPVVSIPPAGNKTERARGFAAQQQNGNVALLRRTDGDVWGPAPWWDAFVTEFASFDSGEHDDQVDAVVHAFNHLMLTKTPGRAGVATPASSRKRIVAPAPQGVS